MITLFKSIGRQDLLFSLKTYCAAVLAFWLALRFELSNPYWAMATVYVVAQPLAGAVTSKALFRMLGTFMGAAAAIALVPSLVSAPELLCLGLSSWIGLCVFISLLDRSPKTYVFLLGGYTAAIIGFQSVNAPAAVFHTALARVEEIGLGILCSALISRLVFPLHMGPLLAARLDAWLDAAGCWAVDALSGRRDAEATQKNLWRLATDTFALLPLTENLPYDTSPMRYAAPQMRALQQRMTALLPIMTGISEQMGLFEAVGGRGRRMPPIAADIARWIASGKDGEGDDGINDRALRLRIARVVRELEERDGAPWTWRELILLGLMNRLRELVIAWSDCHSLRRDIDAGIYRVPRRLRAVSLFSGESALHRDTGAALFSGISTAVATLVCCAFWIAVGWDSGANAAMMCATLGSLSASLDNPVPMLKKNAWIMFCCMCFSAVYLLAIMPLVDDFFGLMVVLAPFLLVFGTLASNPFWGVFSMLSCLNLPIMLTLQARPVYDFAAFLNGNMACIFGVIMATAVTAVIRSIGVERSIRRLLRANRQDIAGLLDQPRRFKPAAFMRRVVDRFGLVAQRVATLPDESWNNPARVLTELRVGLNIMDLRMLAAGLPAPERHEIALLLRELRAHFRAAASDRESTRAARLLRQLDEAITILVAPGKAHALEIRCLRALVGIRSGLFFSAPHFEPIRNTVEERIAA